jgi:histone-lysine N-methyltransferase SETMAR
MEYRHKSSPAPNQFKTAPSPGKVTVSAFWGVFGVMHSEFILTGATINSERYIGTLQKMKARSRRFLPDIQQVFLQHGSARSHTSARTTAENHCLGFTVLDHPPHSPDFAPSDFHLFSKLKENLREHQVLSDYEVKTAVKMWFRQQDAQICWDELMDLP